MSIWIAFYAGAALGVAIGIFLSALLRANDINPEDEHEHYHC